MSTKIRISCTCTNVCGIFDRLLWDTLCVGQPLKSGWKEMGDGLHKWVDNCWRLTTTWRSQETLKWSQGRFIHEPRVQVCFMLRLRVQLVMWMQDGCTSLCGLLQGLKWIMFHSHSNHIQNPPFGGMPNTKPWHHGTSKSYSHWFIIFDHARGPRMNKNILK